MSRSPCAVPPHDSVGRALLLAHVSPKLEPPPSYNDRRGRLWVRLQAHRTLPTSAEFETEWRALRAVLVTAGAESPDHRLASALDALDQAWGAAVRSGMLGAWE
jgi:hypothetical protein